MTYDQHGVEDASRALLEAVGEDITREGLRDTPSRMGRAWRELLSGLEEDPRDHLKTTFEVGTDEIVMVRDIPFYSVCEHHLLPFYGHAHVGYIPKGGRVTGLSKLARVVEGYARLAPQGVIVVVEAEHMCMTMRGISKPGSSTVTSALRGIVKRDATRAEMMSLALGGVRR